MQGQIKADPQGTVGPAGPACLRGAAMRVQRLRRWAVRRQPAWEPGFRLWRRVRRPE